MSYAVKEMFSSPQGEGANIGRMALFIRFAGCNLWSGREQDRGQAVCQFCDTDFVGGARMTAGEILAAAAALFPSVSHRFCVLTGGEPLLQADEPLIAGLREAGFAVAVETNGTQALPCPVDWLCVSPKAGVPLVLSSADELKLVYPQPGLRPDDLAAFQAAHRWLSPMDTPGRLAANVEAAAAFCRARPEWRLAIQAHKVWGVR